MPKFLLKDDEGEGLLIAEAADYTDAELYGFRHVPGFSGRVERLSEGEGSDPLQESLTDAFLRLGLSESAAGKAAQGRGLAGEGPPPGSLADSFERLGLSESAAGMAAAGRDSSSTSQDGLEVVEVPRQEAELLKPRPAAERLQSSRRPHKRSNTIELREVTP